MDGDKKFKYRILIICFTVFFAGCSNQEDSSENKQIAEDLAIEMQELLSKPDQEAIALLSVKYALNANIVEKIIDQYLTETDFTYRILKKSREIQKNKQDMKIATGALNKSEYLELINQISQEFSLKPSIVASVLFDFKIWAIAEEVKSISSSD